MYWLEDGSLLFRAFSFQTRALMRSVCRSILMQTVVELIDLDIWKQQTMTEVCYCPVEWDFATRGQRKFIKIFALIFPGTDGTWHILDDAYA